MSTERGKLSEFLAEVINWNWLDFCKAETDPQYSGTQAVVLSLVRTCAEGRLGAIRLAIERLDGRLVTPVKFEMPKMWLRFPHAKSITGGEALPELPEPEETGIEEAEPETVTAATLSLRQMVEKMADQPREVVSIILARRKEVERLFKEGAKIEDAEAIEKKIPMVKSVITANLLKLAMEGNNFDAITEVFDQMEGKLVETIKVLDGDVYLTSYALEAPPGAIRGKDGVLMIEDKEVAQAWSKRLKPN